MKIIGNIGHKLGLERQILIDGLRGWAGETAVGGYYK